MFYVPATTLYSRQHAAGGILEAHVGNLALALQRSLLDTHLLGLSLASRLRALVLLAARRMGLDILPAEIALVPVDTHNVMRLASKSK